MINKNLYRPIADGYTFDLNEVQYRRVRIGCAIERINPKEWRKKGRYYIYGARCHVKAKEGESGLLETLKEAVEAMNESKSFTWGLPRNMALSTLKKRLAYYREEQNEQN